MNKYIYQRNQWPEFTWDGAKVAELLARVHQGLGRLMGRMDTVGFHFRDEALLRTLTEDVVKNSAIEDVVLDVNQVRSSIARRLGMDIAGLVSSDRSVDGMVEMMLDATQNYEHPLNKKRLCAWHAALFPTSYSGMRKIKVAAWRGDIDGPMQVISGAIGRERVHYEAPEAKQIDKEMKLFFSWFDKDNPLDPIIKAGIAHLWFITIHPFEDGNGRIARCITDLQLARANKSCNRFYSMSRQIKLERTAYYDVLEQTQKGGLDITVWLQWFLSCLERSLHASDKFLSDVLKRAHFWEKHKAQTFNDRQRKMLTKLLEGIHGKLTSTKWAKMTKCSQDTALRDIQDLLSRGILVKEAAGGRSTAYMIAA